MLVLNFPEEGEKGVFPGYPSNVMKLKANFLHIDSTTTLSFNISPQVDAKTSYAVNGDHANILTHGQCCPLPENGGIVTDVSFVATRNTCVSGHLDAIYLLLHVLFSEVNAYPPFYLTGKLQIFVSTNRGKLCIVQHSNRTYESLNTSFISEHLLGEEITQPESLTDN